MKNISIVFVGVGGYGDSYLTLYTKYSELYEDTVIAGIVDPYVEKAPKYRWITENNISVFSTLQEFYSTYKADLAVISTPIPLHKEQILTALQNGSNVLCEKPLVPTIDDAYAIISAIRRYKKQVGVGFQWSFSKPILQLKSDILNGRFGAPIALNSLISWKRECAYYHNTWKGNIKTADGNYILDSVVTNATAHYLHNIFFVLGDNIGSAKIPISVEAEVYRSKPIESFDTAILSGKFEGGASFWYGATHSGDKEDVTTFTYQFEKGNIYFNTFKNDSHVYAKFSDGNMLDYGNPQEFAELNGKLVTMINYCRNPKTTIPCSVNTVLPHLQVCNGLFSAAGIQNIDKNMVFEGSNPKGSFVHGLSDGLFEAYNSSKLPSELNLSFAGNASVFVPSEITSFEGIKSL